MSRYNFDPQSPVVLVPCESYDENTVKTALEAVLAPIGGLDWVVPGMTVGIKANLVSALAGVFCESRRRAASTTPSLLRLPHTKRTPETAAALSGAACEKQPVSRMGALGFFRCTRRASWPALRSASAVTVQVLIT